MITIQAYRAVIGSFLQRARSIQRQNNVHQSCNSNWEKGSVGGNQNTSHLNLCWDMIYFQRTFVMIFIAIVMYCNMNLTFLKLLQLMSDGDIESNPGPTYSILKVVQASHHQGDNRYGNTAGNQCSCNSLFAIVWSFLRNVALWNTFDLDHILLNGDLVYKKLNVNRSLFISDLPNRIDTDNGTVNISM